MRFLLRREAHEEFSGGASRFFKKRMVLCRRRRVASLKALVVVFVTELAYHVPL